MPEQKGNVNKIGAFLRSAETPSNTVGGEPEGGGESAAGTPGDLRTLFLRRLAEAGPQRVLDLLGASGEAYPYSQSQEAIRFLQDGELISLHGEPGSELAHLTRRGEELAAVLHE